MKFRSRLFRGQGFTLLELLVVLALIAVLAATMLPSLLGVVSSTSLRGSSDNVKGLLELARQTSATRNTPVQLRIYQDPTKANDANGNAPYRILAAVIPSTSTGTADEFLTVPMSLPGDVIFDSNSAQSSLLNSSLGSAGLRPIAATESTGAPLSVRSRPYVGFTFLADGSVNLDQTQQWCLTLYNQNLSRTAGPNGSPSNNFVTFVLDVPTGRVRTYQP
jgi:uncharacterized protein (TIGR02596 family)